MPLVVFQDVLGAAYPVSVLTVPKDESVWSSKPDLAETGIDKGLDRQELDAYNVFWERVSDVLNE